MAPMINNSIALHAWKAAGFLRDKLGLVPINAFLTTRSSYYRRLGS